MNRTGLRNYLKYHTPDRELLRLAYNYGESQQSRHNDYKVWSSLDSLLRSSGWPPEKAAEQRQRVSSNSELFRIDEHGDVEGVSKSDLAAEARRDMEGIVDWLACASDFELAGDIALFRDLRDLVEEDDPLEMFDAIGFECKDLGLSDSVEWPTACHDYEVTLSVGDISHTFEFRPSTITAPTKPSTLRAIFEDARWLSHFCGDLKSLSFATGLDKGDDRGIQRAQELSDKIERNYQKLADLLEGYDLDALDRFIQGIALGIGNIYDDISWQDLEDRGNREKMASKASKKIDSHGADLENTRREMADSLGGQEPPEAGRDLPGDVLE